MTRVSITIDLELDEAADRPVGMACLQDGTARRFHGWLDLAEAISALARTTHEDSPTTTPENEEITCPD